MAAIANRYALAKSGNSLCREKMLVNFMPPCCFTEKFLCLLKQLLYVFTADESAEDFVPSQYYGFIHLLRLFVKFGKLLS